MYTLNTYSTYKRKKKLGLKKFAQKTFSKYGVYFIKKNIIWLPTAVELETTPPLLQLPIYSIPVSFLAWGRHYLLYKIKFKTLNY